MAQGDLTQRAALRSRDELGILSNTFDDMASQLQTLIGTLEQSIAARTRDLATVASISAQTSIIRDPEQILATAVRLTQRGFNLYHTHVFSYHEENHELEIIACGYKEGDEHEGTHGLTTIPVAQEQSLVARAARTRKTVIVNNVRSDPGWLPNPILPDTRAEMAVPLIVGDELLGVLDVQADHEDAFTESDANIQMTLASQIATSYQSALAYEKAKSQAELESLVNAIGQKIQRTTSMEDTLQTAIRELGLALGASIAKIQLSARAIQPAQESQPEEQNA
jgi:GAF domain-containing protein